MMETKKEHILIVDDDTLFGEMLERYISSNIGYAVTFCASGEEAQRLLQHQLFDLIILDYKMPGISGLDVLRWMKATLIDTPVLMVTNLDSEENAMEAIRLGAYDYIRKDQLDLIHLPVLLESVTERYHYRKGQSSFEDAKRNLDRHLSQLEQLQQAIEALGSMIANSMSSLSLGIDECQQDLLPQVPDSDRIRLTTALMDIKKEYNFVCSSVNSIVGLTQSFRAELPNIINEGNAQVQID